MLGSLKAKLFPCEKIMARLMDCHAESIRMNNEAHERLVSACNQGVCQSEPMTYEKLMKATNDATRRMKPPLVRSH